MSHLLARFGYAKATVEDLARETGIGKGTVYLHFNSKEDVALSLVDRSVGKVLEELREIAADSGASAAERLHRMLVARVVGRSLQFRGFSSSLHELLAALRPTLVAQRDQHLRREAATFRVVLEEGHRSQELKAPDPDRVAHTLLTATNSLLPYYLSPRELGSLPALRERADTLAALLVAGLLAGSRTQQNRPRVLTQ